MCVSSKGSAISILEGRQFGISWRSGARRWVRFTGKRFVGRRKKGREGVGSG